MYHLRGAGLIFLVLSLVFGGESRLSATIFTVINSDNAGSGSLRQAILNANTNVGKDTIQFQIPGTPPFTIFPTATLPSIDDPVIIDATTQSGFINQPVIELNGLSAGSDAIGLLILSGNSTVRGLAIDKFAVDGIRLEGNGTNIVEGNFIGAGLSGNSDSGNGQGGVTINQSRDNIIGGTTAAARNIISGHNLTGVAILDVFPRTTPHSVGNRVLGNFIGADVTGTIDHGNLNDGILLFESPQNTIGGFSAAERNVISGNDQSGIYLSGLGASGNLIVGNFIGTDSQGVNSLSNTIGGIIINGGSSNQIGSASSGGRNLISGNTQRGIFINGVGAQANSVQGNYIGTDVSGTAKVPNTDSGVRLDGGCFNNVIGGILPGARNLISGNNQSGIFITNSTGNLVQGNFIGTAANGTQALGNSAFGINLSMTSDNRIGGTNAAQRNLISGNSRDGVYIFGGSASNNLVQGNFIGTDLNGTAALGNGTFSGGTDIGGINITNAPSNVIGGSANGAGNLISGNIKRGIYFQGANARFNRVEGNFIGTDVSGTLAVPNTGGIYFYGSPSNTIGGTATGAGNLISGNLKIGISIGDAGANGNIFQGNWIGTKADKISPLGSEWFAIEILSPSSNNIIGTVGAGNVIAYAQNLYAGVRVHNGCSRNSIRGNSIFSNTGPGIDLDPYRSNPNDVGDADSGANDWQNFPEITSVSGRYITIMQGTFNSATNKVFALDFYASPEADLFGYGEGKTWLGAINLTTDGTGNAGFIVKFTNAVPVDRFITATATDANGNTSEFSKTNGVNAPFLDSDSDGMPDEFEIAAGLDPFNPADAALDSDGDGLSNLNEYLAATDPNDASSGLRLLPLIKSASGALLRFQTVYDRRYGIEFTTNFTAWDLLPNATNIVGDKTLIQINDNAASTAPKRFYRVHLLP